MDKTEYTLAILKRGEFSIGGLEVGKIVGGKLMLDQSVILDAIDVEIRYMEDSDPVEPISFTGRITEVTELEDGALMVTIQSIAEGAAAENIMALLRE